MKKLLGMFLALALLLSSTAVYAEVLLAYPDRLIPSEGEALKLEKMPERIICLSNSALQILLRCGLKPIAVSHTASYVLYPDWIKELPVIQAGMSALDTESIISMNPDLVIMGVHFKEKYSSILADAGIPVYYTSEGPSIPYEDVKKEAIAIVSSFGDEKAIEEIANDFKALEEKATAFHEKHPMRKMMILFGGPQNFYQQTSQGYLGSMLALLPFENLSDELVGAEKRTVPLDLEMLIELDPDIIFCISPMSRSAEQLKEQYAGSFEENPDLWKNLKAYKSDQIFYLAGEYVTSKGIHVVKSIDALMTMLDK